MLSPAWNSAIGEILPREELPQAIVAMSIAYNSARALGPALAGFASTRLAGGCVATGRSTGGGVVFMRWRWWARC